MPSPLLNRIAHKVTGNNDDMGAIEFLSINRKWHLEKNSYLAACAWPAICGGMYNL